MKHLGCIRYWEGTFNRFLDDIQGYGDSPAAGTRPAACKESIFRLKLKVSVFTIMSNYFFKFCHKDSSLPNRTRIPERMVGLGV